jgi:hypothetical protein
MREKLFEEGFVSARLRGPSLQAAMEPAKACHPK